MRPPVLALLWCVFSVTTGEFVVAGILPGVAADLAVSLPAAGLVVTAYAAGMILGGPTVTAVTARFPRKPLTVALLAVAVLGNLASACAPGYGVLIAARVVTALVTSTFFANAIVIAVSTAAPERQASTVSRLAFGMNLAMILGAPAGTLLGGALGWRAPFAAVTVGCAVGLLLVLWLVPAGQAPAGTSAVAELSVFRDGNVLLAVAVTAVGNAGVLTYFVYIAPLLTDVAGIAAGSVAALLLLYGLGATAGNAAGGWLADRAAMASQVGLLGVLAGLLAAGWLVGTRPAPAVVLVFLLGAASFAVIPGMQSRVLTTAASAPTLAVAVNASAYQLAAAFAGWFGGRVIDGAGLRAVYVAGAVVTVAGLAVSCGAWVRDRGDARRRQHVA